MLTTRRLLLFERGRRGCLDVPVLSDIMRSRGGPDILAFGARGSGTVSFAGRRM